MVGDKRDDDERHRTGRSRDHRRTTSGNGDDHRDNKGGIEPDHRVDSRDEGEGDGFRDERQGDDDPGQNVGSDISEPFVFQRIQSFQKNTPFYL